MESLHLQKKYFFLSVSSILFYVLGFFQRVFPFFFFSAFSYGISKIAVVANLPNFHESQQQQPRKEENPAPLSYNGTLKEMVRQYDGALAATDIPECFVLPPHLQPGLSAKGDPKAANLPLIDMTGVCDNPERRKQVAESIAEACRTWGFFQVVGHGVPSPSSTGTRRRSTVLATKNLATTIFELIAEGLNLKGQQFYDVLGGADQMEYHLMLGFYPQCLQPEKALGLIGHTDPNLITLLVQDEPGLEVLKDGLWIPVEPARNGFVINIGDSLQIMSNDMYKSNEHRVLASKRRDRMSAMILVTPKAEVNLSVVRELVPSNATAVYNDIPWGSYLNFARQGLDTKLTKLALK